MTRQIIAQAEGPVVLVGSINHADGTVAMDLFVVPTISFRLLYGLLIMCDGRRQILWLGVTARPTAKWITNQLTEARGWEQIPRNLIRDRDGAYGEIFIRRVRFIDPSVFETARRLRVHPGKTTTPNDQSARSAGNASIVSWCSANAICAMCCCPTGLL